jgi:hypothetical protein
LIKEIIHDPPKRIELVYTDDQYTKLKAGDKGCLNSERLDPFNVIQFCIKWDNGSNLMLIAGVDQFKFIDEELSND